MTPVICRNCMSRQPEGVRFCGGCGAQLQANQLPARSGMGPVAKFLIVCVGLIAGAFVLGITIEVLASRDESRARDATLLQDSYCFENAEAIGAAVAGIEAGNAGATLNGLAAHGQAVRLAAGDTVQVTQEGKILRVRVTSGYHARRYCFLPSAAVPPAPHYMTPAEQDRHNREVRSMIERHGGGKP